MKYLFRNILGEFVLNQSLEIIQEDKQGTIDLPKDKVKEVLLLFKDKKYFSQFYSENIKLTKQGVKDSVNEDNLIMQAVSNLSELDRVCNILVKRLREWYALYFPEIVHRIDKHEKFVDIVLHNGLTTREDEMGADLEKRDLNQILLLANRIKTLYELRADHEQYLKITMEKYSPNLIALAGVTIGAKLLDMAKGLKRMAFLPASTIQLLGAEKALFRHLKTGGKSPKHGIILHHPLIQGVRRNQRGKAARQLADKISLCCKLDYFKGEFKAEEYKKDLEEKFHER